MKVGTRGSNLAQVQTNYVVDELSKITDENIDIKIVKTIGDKIKDSQLYNIDAKGIFTKELDKYVLNEEVDFAVHSLKDVPTELDPDLEIVAIPPRESPNDVLISNYNWDELSKNFTLGSSSLRREAFCNYHNKEFQLKPLRGNIETRIKKVLNGECDATIMAESGLIRLGLTKYIKKRFSLKYITPAAGQGALAIITRKDSKKKELINKLNDYKTFQEVLAEKTVLKELGVGCQWPLGVIAKIEYNRLNLYSILLTQKGEILSQVKLYSPIKDAEKIGKEAAMMMKEDYN
ncbi:MAG: hydroxymethylbilane synthase [Methanomicrobiales archaeon]